MHRRRVPSLCWEASPEKVTREIKKLWMEILLIPTGSCSQQPQKKLCPYLASYCAINGCQTGDNLTLTFTNLITPLIIRSRLVTILMPVEIFMDLENKYLENFRIKKKKENRINTTGSGDSSVPTTPWTILTLFSWADDSYRHRQIRAVFRSCVLRADAELLL